MKKTLLAAIALCFSLSTMAGGKGEIEGLSWQAFLGMNVSKIRGSIDMDGISTAVNGKVGLDIGIKGEYYLPDAHGTYISAAIEWTQKGGKQKIYVGNDDVEFSNPYGSYPGKHKINEHYISIPIHLGYRHYLNDDWSVFGEAGPYFSVGVCGKNKFIADQEGSAAKAAEWSYKTFDKNTNNSKSSGGFQRFDCGVGFQVGTEYMDHYSLNLGFDWGLTDMLRGDYRDKYFDDNHFSADKLKNFCFSLTLGYRF